MTNLGTSPRSQPPDEAPTDGATPLAGPESAQDVQAEPCEVPEFQIAVDAASDIMPVKMYKSLQLAIRAINFEAKSICKNEKQARIADQDGNMRAVVDEAGRDHFRSLVLDLQDTARRFSPTAQSDIEQALEASDERLTACPTALAIPTGKPLSHFSWQTYPACYTDGWYGDGAPGLPRDRPMLFEQVARRLLVIEEHEYSLEGDAEPHRARPRSRFSKLEILPCWGTSSDGSDCCLACEWQLTEKASLQISERSQTPASPTSSKP